MKREHAIFLAAGVVLGFVAGFVVAWGLGRDSGPVRAGAPLPSRGSSVPAAAGGDDMMSQVRTRIAELKASLDREPDDTASLLELANLYMQAGMYAPAQDYLVRAVELDPSDVHARTHLGISLGQTGELEGARAQFEETVALDPSYWEAWYYLAATAVRQGDLEGARRGIARLEALNPTLPEIAELKAHLAEATTARP